jgi:hypothetical protein
VDNPCNFDRFAVGVEDVLAGLELVGAFELLVGGRPERVILGGADRLPTNEHQRDQDVVVDMRGLDGFGFLVAGLGSVARTSSPTSTSSIGLDD